MGHGNGFGRRRALQLAAGTTAAAVAGSAARHAAAGTVAGVARDVSFDADWRFFRGDPAGAESTDFDDGDWRRLDVPHDWSIEDLEGSTGSGAETSNPALWTTYESPPAQIGPFLNVPADKGQANYDTPAATAWTVGGVGWYRKHFALDGLASDRQIEIRFDGVYEAVDVYVNGVHLGFHPYGYTSFAFDLSTVVDRNGTNVVAVRVAAVGRTSRWYSGSGIYRHVWLTTTGPVLIPLWGVSVTTPNVSTSAATVNLAVELESRLQPVGGAVIEASVQDPLGRVVAGGSTGLSVARGATGTASLSLSIPSPDLWSPDTPFLYTADIVVLVGGVAVDAVRQTFGVRRVVIDGTQGFFLNGKSLKMKGACIHHTNGALGAKAIDRAEVRRVEQLKLNGFNAVRSSHNPPSPAFLDACDRLGLLVYDEAFDCWDAGKNPQDYSLYFNRYWPSDITSMVLRDRNHPSVVLWSVGNEIPDGQTQQGGVIGRNIHNLISTLDPTRMVTGGGLMTYPTLEYQGPEYDYLDLADIHYQPGIYAEMHRLHPTKAIISSESLPYFAYDSWVAVEQAPYVIGDFVWTGIDYLGESGLGNVFLEPAGGEPIEPFSKCCTYDFDRPYPMFNSYCGDIDLAGEKKPQSYYRDVLWGRSSLEMFVQRPTPAGQMQGLSAWGWPDELKSWSWPVAAGQELIVNVYTSGDMVALLLNEHEVGRQTLTSADKLRARFTVGYAPGLLLAVAYRNGQVIGVQALETVGPAHGLLLLPDQLLLAASRNDLAHVLAVVADEFGRRVPDAVVEVMFAVDGPGELAAVGNANPQNVDSFQGPGRQTYHGAALAVVRPLGSTGSVTLHAQAAGLAPASVTLPVV